MALPNFLLERHGLQFRGSVGGPVVRNTTSSNDPGTQNTEIDSSGPAIQLDNRNNLCNYCRDLLHKASKGKDTGKDTFRHYALLIDLKASGTNCSMCSALLQTLDSKDIAAAVLPSLEHEVWKLYCRDRTFNFYRYSSRVRDFKLKGLYRCKGGFREEENGDEYCSGATFTFCIGDGIISQRPYWRDGSIPTALERISNPVLSDWIKTCNGGPEHATCHSKSGTNSKTPLPTRVLNVGPFPNSTEAKLVISSGQHGRYLALSHCWGTHQPLTTTSSTRSERMIGISRDELPPTFLHAIQVTRQLGIQYLWIDSLCIVQGDREEWEREAVKMGDVYHNAYITIAAAAAMNSLGGLFWPCKQASSFSTDKGIVVHWKTQERAHADNLWPIYDSPLGRRAWTLQEALLSTRIIHFGEDQLYWECASKRCSEDGAIDMLHGKSYLSLKPSKDTPITFAMFNEEASRVHANWMSMAMTYSRRQITQLGDKIPALAGITSFSQSLTGDVPLLGLWQSTLHADLLWEVPRGSAKAMPSDLGLPSWSWLSVNGPIDYPDYFSRSKEHIDLIHTHIEWTAADSTSNISVAELVIRGKLSSATLLRGTGKRPTKGTRKGLFMLQMWNETHKSDCIGKGRIDCDEGGNELPVKCLLVQTTPPSGARPMMFEVLLLRSVDGRRFCRVGTGSFPDSEELWKEERLNEQTLQQRITPFDGISRSAFTLV